MSYVLGFVGFAVARIARITCPESLSRGYFVGNCEVFLRVFGGANTGIVLVLCELQVSGTVAEKPHIAESI